MTPTAEGRPLVVDRVTGHCGELALRRAGAHFEIVANGTFLMDTRNGESERLLVRVAGDRMPGGRMLVAGLGVGFSLRAALDHPSVDEVTVVEREPAVIAWNEGPLRDVNGGALTAPGLRCVEADLLEWLPRAGRPFDAICVDIDNGPQWTVEERNAPLYTEHGVGLLASALVPGGVLTVWSAADAPEFVTALRARFATVEALRVPVPRGEPDVVYVASTATTARVAPGVAS